MTERDYAFASIVKYTGNNSSTERTAFPVCHLENIFSILSIIHLVPNTGAPFVLMYILPKPQKFLHDYQDDFYGALNSQNIFARFEVPKESQASQYALDCSYLVLESWREEKLGYILEIMKKKAIVSSKIIRDLRHDGEKKDRLKITPFFRGQILSVTDKEYDPVENYDSLMVAVRKYAEFFTPRDLIDIFRNSS